MRLRFVRFASPVTDTSFKSNSQVTAGPQGEERGDIALSIEMNFLRIEASPGKGRKASKKTLLVPLSNVSYLEVEEETAPAAEKPAAPVKAPAPALEPEARPAPKPVEVKAVPAPEAKHEPKRWKK